MLLIAVNSGSNCNRIFFCCCLSTICYKVARLPPLGPLCLWTPWSTLCGAIGTQLLDCFQCRWVIILHFELCFASLRVCSFEEACSTCRVGNLWQPTSFPVISFEIRLKFKYCMSPALKIVLPWNRAVLLLRWLSAASDNLRYTLLIPNCNL